MYLLFHCTFTRESRMVAIGTTQFMYLLFHSTFTRESRNKGSIYREMHSRSFKDHYSSPQCTAAEIIIDASKMTVGDPAKSEERRKEKLYNLFMFGEDNHPSAVADLEGILCANITTYTMSHTNHTRIPKQIAKDPMTHSICISQLHRATTERVEWLAKISFFPTPQGCQPLWSDTFKFCEHLQTQ